MARSLFILNLSFILYFLKPSTITKVLLLFFLPSFLLFPLIVLDGEFIRLLFVFPPYSFLLKYIKQFIQMCPWSLGCSPLILFFPTNFLSWTFLSALLTCVRVCVCVCRVIHLLTTEAFKVLREAGNRMGYYSRFLYSHSFFFYRKK